MAHTVHPKIFRIGIIYSSDSKWFAKKHVDFSKFLRQDMEIKGYLKKKLKEAMVDRVVIERTLRALTVTIHSGKPGVIIGRGGTGIEDLKKGISTILKVNKNVDKNKDKSVLNVNVVELAKPGLSANLTIQSMIADIEKRMPFRRVLKQSIDRAQKAGAKGVKVYISGRLNGAEIARAEKLSWGTVPTSNLRADIDYASDFAMTIFGTIGIKVWIYRGEIFKTALKKMDQPTLEAVKQN